MKLFIAGGGSAEDSINLDKVFASHLEKNKTIAYIPIATESRPYNECYEWVHSVFDSLGIKKIEMWTDLSDKKIANKLKTIGALYIGGGNTFKLLSKMRESGFDKLLIKFINDGGLVYGGSAGAIILGKSILTSGDKNNVKLKDFSGLNLLDDVSVWCHYTPADEPKIFNLAKKIGSIFAIPEKSGIFVNGKERKIIGFDPSYVYDASKKVILKVDSTFSHSFK